MKHEVCPECGVIRECKVWRHCHCGHDFEPGYVYHNAKQTVFETESSWTEAAYAKGVIGLGVFGSLAFLFSEYVVESYPLQIAGALALVIGFWLPAGFRSDKRPHRSIIAKRPRKD